MLKHITSASGIQRSFLENITDKISSDKRFCGLSISGSGSLDTLDEYSDLDLILVIKDARFDEVMSERFSLAENFGSLLCAFTGEHVGEPRVLICLYDQDDLLHVDLKFVAATDVHERVDNPIVLWEEEKLLSAGYQVGKPHYPLQDIQWFEDRIWVWMHYGASKVARGELFEGLEFISFLRQQAIAPLAKKVRGMEPNGIRRIESQIPDFAEKLAHSVAQYSKTSIFESLQLLANLYIEIRENYMATGHDVKIHHKAQSKSQRYLNSLLENNT